MAPINTITLLLNGITLALALSVLVIILWHDARKELNQFLAVFLIMVALWIAGSLVSQAIALVAPDSELKYIANSVLQLGFTGSSIAVYALAAVLVKVQPRRFRLLTFAGLSLVLGYRVFLMASNAPTFVSAVEGSQPSVQPLTLLFYILFDGAAFYLLWRYRRKIRTRGLYLGLMLFIAGQSLGFLNPQLEVFSMSVNVSAVASLLISFSIVGEEIVVPLAQRNSQVEAIRSVNLAITGQSAIEAMLEKIAAQSALLLSADGVGVYLRNVDALELVMTHGLPEKYRGAKIAIGDGLVGTVARSRQTQVLASYADDWQGADDLPLARETFGSVVCTPLLYSEQAIGALLVVAARHGRLFQREDAYLLELLGMQAAVAIAHSRLFEEQRSLTQQVEVSRSQLEAVLANTQSPVLAVNRELKLIFANPAARLLFPDDAALYAASADQQNPLLPPDLRAALRDLRKLGVHVYEVSVNDKIYLCYLTNLGYRRSDGWVAVLNDVTQLKELDRLKSEMVRMTSHDLKNPLQAAMANLELLRDDIYETADEEVKQSIVNIDKQLDRMSRIISGILDLERVKAGTPSFEVCAPAQLIDSAVGEMRFLAEDRGVTLEVTHADVLPSFVCDVEQFGRAIINLLENAIKFTPSGGRVQVSARVDGDRIQFEVADTGVGIESDVQARVFDRFYRAKQKGMEHVSGSGLGLSLVKAVVESHHGEVWLESAAGAGTKVHVTVPLSHPVKFGNFA
jgi:signal transduction histidine kinase